ncbi:MAG: hypothetical protein BWZ10_01785 [candidate division BRC1 bacterium ADurb.BinA364]|nr:MAG: hypothetical protein BWZ10_01785 [candidate division BRC1 bacterium ADurb.BinA364]
MDAWESGRFVVRVEEGPPRGGLYELEQTTYFHVVDTRTNLPAMTFLGELEASLSAETGLWENYRCSGVREAAIAPDGRSVLVRRFDGSEETVGLPESGDG